MSTENGSGETSTQTSYGKGGGEKGEVLLEMRGLKIEGMADDVWHEIVHGVDVTLHRGEVLGLIGESGAGKSTIGIASMGYAKPGCRISERRSINCESSAERASLMWRSPRRPPSIRRTS
jgi:ABC-type glutathione transport system ATPase component